jgi:abortive infection bacteriophage resistance protein
MGDGRNYDIRQLSKWYANLSTSADRNAIANVYGMDEINLVSFLHHLSTVRNICAHHSRLWNREFTFTFKLPKKRPKQLLQVLNFSPSTSKRIYNTLVMLDYLMVIAYSGEVEHPFRRKVNAFLPLSIG